MEEEGEEAEEDEARISLTVAAIVSPENRSELDPLMAHCLGNVWKSSYYDIL